VGDHVFTHESGIHVDGLLKDRRTYQSLDPLLLGRSHHFVIGKHSGLSAITASLADLHLPATPDELRAILARVREHAIFEREGSNLTCDVPISFATAALGGSVEVPTLEGGVVLKIPPETQSGRVFRVREKGVVPVRGGPMPRNSGSRDFVF